MQGSSFALHWSCIPALHWCKRKRGLCPMPRMYASLAICLIELKQMNRVISSSIPPPFTACPFIYYLCSHVKRFVIELAGVACIFPHLECTQRHPLCDLPYIGWQYTHEATIFIGKAEISRALTSPPSQIKSPSTDYLHIEIWLHLWW